MPQLFLFFHSCGFFFFNFLTLSPQSSEKSNEYCNIRWNVVHTRDKYKWASHRTGPSEVINYYLLSLASADLLCGLLVVPLSVYPALVRRWVYGDIVCRLVGYLEVTLWAVSVYTFMWISVDRYLAIRYVSISFILFYKAMFKNFWIFIIFFQKIWKTKWNEMFK